MKEDKLSIDELFELTTTKIGHLSDLEQLKFVLKCVQARIEIIEERKKQVYRG